MSPVSDATVVESNNVLGLRCRECGREFAVAPIYTCEWCFGPLEVAYDYAGVTRESNVRVSTMIAEKVAAALERHRADA